MSISIVADGPGKPVGLMIWLQLAVFGGSKLYSRVS